MDAISHFCQGYSHIASGKPCQDCAYAESTPSLSMAIVSDGHGGDRYFRSDRGSRLLVEITADAIRKFAETVGIDRNNKEYNVGERLFANAPFTQFGQKLSDGNSMTDKKVHENVSWLFSSIISQWNVAIEKDVQESPLSNWEKEHVESKYLDEFNNALSHEKTYGCTLMAFVQTPTYWLAFQIGDGKLLTMSIEDDSIVFSQPVPWDERCFLNKTTSICDSEAINEFRYCYGGDGHFPIAAFLGSDGLDDTYGDGELLEDFYMNVYLEIAKGKNKALVILENDLPEISKRGSKDDMSVAVVYDDSHMANVAVSLIDCQLHRNSAKRDEIEKKISDLNDIISRYRDSKLSESDQIKVEYAKKDIAKLTSQLQSLNDRRKKLFGRKGFYTRLTNNQQKAIIIQPEI